MIELEVGRDAPTVSLNWIMSNTTEHREPGMLPDLETASHPWEEVGQGIVSAFDTLGNTGTSARERQCAYAIRSDDNVGVHFG